MKEHPNEDYGAQNHPISKKSSFECLSHGLGNEMRHQYSQFLNEISVYKSDSRVIIIHILDYGWIPKEIFAEKSCRKCVDTFRILASKSTAHETALKWTFLAKYAQILNKSSFELLSHGLENSSHY